MRGTPLSLRGAVLFHRLGPYHIARLAAASEVVETFVLELSGETKEYAWDKIDSATPFRRFTLFPGEDVRDQPLRVVKHRVERILNELRPAIVAIPGWSEKAGLVALRWCLRNGCPVILMSESCEHDEKRVWWREAIKQRIVALCSAALVGGKLHRDYLVKLGMPSERVSFGYDVVDNDYFARAAAEIRASAEIVRCELQLPEKYFLASARFIEKKNLHRLLQAYAEYRKVSADPWDLVLLGDGPLRGSLLEQRKNLGLENHVIMPGFKQYDELPAYYALAEVFIHASTTEQWGLVVNEAMASGLPVIVSSRCGCTPELVSPGENGWTFDPSNEMEISGLMSHVSQLGKEGLCRLGAESRKIIAHWGLKRFAEGLSQSAECARVYGSPRKRIISSLVLSALTRR